MYMVFQKKSSTVQLIIAAQSSSSDPLLLGDKPKILRRTLNDVQRNSTGRLPHNSVPAPQQYTDKSSLLREKAFVPASLCMTHSLHHASLLPTTFQAQPSHWLFSKVSPLPLTQVYCSPHQDFRPVGLFHQMGWFAETISPLKRMRLQQEPTFVFLTPLLEFQF